LLGGVIAIAALPSSLPWNTALLLTCAPQLIGIVVIPKLVAALPAPEGASAQPLLRAAGGEQRDGQPSSHHPNRVEHLSLVRSPSRRGVDRACVLDDGAVSGSVARQP